MRRLGVANGQTAVDMSNELSSAVRFTTASIRLPLGVGCGVFMIGGVGYIQSAFDHPGVEVGLLVFGIVFLIGASMLLLSVLRGYAITVTGSSVKLHRLWTREIAFDRIASVEVDGPIMRTVQQRVCLRFTFPDGSIYLFKDFNGSTSESSESYKRVYDAMLLIRQRLGESRAESPDQRSRPGQVGEGRSGSAGLPLPPPPRNLGDGHRYDDPGGSAM